MIRRYFDAASAVTAAVTGLPPVHVCQAREPLTLDFPSAQHTVIAGAARSGRSSLLRTLAGAVAARTSPADVHIYGIDCGAGALLPVSELPHCGAVVAREQVDRVERLLSKLRNEIARRQQLLAAQGFAGLAEQRAAAKAGRYRAPDLTCPANRRHASGGNASFGPSGSFESRTATASGITGASSMQLPPLLL
jgi:S-DNA-T family DNA segregation ATPase FtsK/SpoIIIE